MRFDAADQVLRGAAFKRFTAAVVRVELAGTLAFERAYGRVDDTPEGRSIGGATRFDLASISKVFTSTAALRAVAGGRLKLDDSLAPAVREWRGTEHEPITLRMLLAHDAGMQSGADYRQLLGSEVERFALETPLAAAPGERVIYSDLGFIALGTVLERVHGTSLAHVIAETTQAVGADATAFRPRRSLSRDIPATEEDAWRGRVRGFVHDEKAYLMGGAAGHAGLFGTAADVARLTDAYLAAASGRNGGAALPKELALEAIAEAAYDPVLRRGLGWALKTSDENSCGRHMSMQTFGHTGFTGTCVWADPQRDLSIVLLTNAVYYGRRDLREVRAAVCDAVVEAVDSC